MKSFPLHQADFYKLSHKGFMEPGTKALYANLTARSGKYARWEDSLQRVVYIGGQHFFKDFLIEEFNNEFFLKPKAEVVGKLKHRCDTSLGPDAVSMEHFEALHDLGYLPLAIKTLPEGSKVDIKVPLLTIQSTHPDFAWLVTYIETVLSTELWGSTTAATTAYQYLTLCNKFADETVGNRNHVMFQCHDFSARGMIGRHAGALTGIGHLASFSGTDTIAAIDLVEDYYNEDASTYFIAGSVPASEHSVTSLGSSVNGEAETIKRWITECYPTGIVSVVSDTYDYWNVITNVLPSMEAEIKARKPNALGLAKVVVRPDSGDPVRIIAGYRPDEVYMNADDKIIVRAAQAYDEYEITQEEYLGSIEVLGRKFGWTTNALGYRELPPYIGLIYGDSITLDRAREIFSRLQQAGWSSSNVVFGVGSFTYQLVSRDTLGMAVKATWALVNDEPKELFKDPKTDNGTKKSARGLLRVEGDDKVGYTLFDQQTGTEEASGALRLVFENSKLLIDEKFSDIRNRVHDIKPEVLDTVAESA